MLSVATIAVPFTNDMPVKTVAKTPAAVNPTFAVLVELRMTEEGDIEDLDEEADIFMAKVEIDEDGEETYTDPTDEEFEAALAAYEELFDDEDEDEAE